MNKGDEHPDPADAEKESCCSKCCCGCVVKCPCGFAIFALVTCLVISGLAWIDIAWEAQFPHNIETDVSAYIRVAHAQVPKKNRLLPMLAQCG